MFSSDRYDMMQTKYAKEFTITNEKMHSDCDHTIWEGVTVHGYPVRTYSRGKLVCIDGEFVGEKGWGKLIRCRLK